MADVPSVGRADFDLDTLRHWARRLPLSVHHRVRVDARFELRSTHALVSPVIYERPPVPGFDVWTVKDSFIPKAVFESFRATLKESAEQFFAMRYLIGRMHDHVASFHDLFPPGASTYFSIVIEGEGETFRENFRGDLEGLRTFPLWDTSVWSWDAGREMSVGEIAASVGDRLTTVLVGAAYPVQSRTRRQSDESEL